jgi:hypothetical protein
MGFPVEPVPPGDGASIGRLNNLRKGCRHDGGPCPSQPSKTTHPRAAPDIHHARRRLYPGSSEPRTRTCGGPLLSEPNVDHIRASLRDLVAVQIRHHEAFTHAQGVYADNPVTPTTMALVWQGKLGDLQIADSVCSLPPHAAAALINGVVINAFNAWHLDLTQLLAATRSPS